MKIRWTIKNLKESTDYDIIHSIIYERLSELKPYSPLFERLDRIYHNLNELIIKQTNNNITNNIEGEKT
jgi:hypothetical protein